VRERWSTAEQIAAKIAEFEAALGPSWRRPVAHGIGHQAGGRPVVDRLNVGAGHLLPAVVLATVTGYRCGVRAMPMTAADLDRAIHLLEPAEAYPGSRHPNLRTWRRLRAEIGDHGTAVALFADRLDGPDEGDAFVRAFLAAIRRDRPGAPVA